MMFGRRLTSVCFILSFQVLEVVAARHTIMLPELYLPAIFSSSGQSLPEQQPRPLGKRGASDNGTRVHPPLRSQVVTHNGEMLMKAEDEPRGELLGFGGPMEKGAKFTSIEKLEMCGSERSGPQSGYSWFNCPQDTTCMTCVGGNHQTLAKGMQTKSDGMELEECCAMGQDSGGSLR
ncbi:hypothetical protein CYMTET_15964 [Cymbomonas tetramitiformis]|uniref:Uncharacterized protein n=1 Tax=Cymbomonas tetramitiformis TaxID=36881 RepID=A0AAE0GD55_9CHLO|nr:hypothetical protein CYMTET_15964 [Cymbomonas tetramitiformis]